MTSLALLQLVSPALPVGAFSYSEGLEVLIQAGSISDEQAIQAWLEAELQRGAVRGLTVLRTRERYCVPMRAARLRYDAWRSKNMRSWMRAWSMSTPSMM